MGSPGQRHADQIRDNIACPQCDYSLRGLTGAIVTCPECGLEVDVVRAVTSRWNKSWHRAPGLNRLLMPVAWLVCSSMAVFMLWIFETQSWRRSTPWLTLAAATIVLLLWIAWLYRLRHALENGLAVPLSLFGHVLFALYLVGIFLLFYALMRFINSIAWSPAGMTIHGVQIAIGVAVLVGCRRGERYIASHCIRQHLIDRAKADTMSA